MSDNTLRIGSWSGNKVYIESTKILANSGLDYPRLIIPIRFDLKPIKESSTNVTFYNILNITSELFLREKHLKVSDSIPNNRIIKVIHDGVGPTYNLEFPLNYKRITKIEEFRTTNIAFELNMHATIGLLEQSITTSFEDSYIQLSFEIEQSYWVKNILPALNYGEYFIIEIPKGEKTIAEAWNYIEKAEESFRMWNSKGAFANCREVGTLLDNHVKEKLAGNPIIKKWKVAIEKFNALLSLDLHVENIKNASPKGYINVNKNDTEYIIIVTKSILKYAEGLLKESTNFHNAE